MAVEDQSCNEHHCSPDACRQHVDGCRCITSIHTGNQRNNRSDQYNVPRKLFAQIPDRMIFQRVRPQAFVRTSNARCQQSGASKRHRRSNTRQQPFGQGQQYEIESGATYIGPRKTHSGLKKSNGRINGAPKNAEYRIYRKGCRRSNPSEHLGQDAIGKRRGI